MRDEMDLKKLRRLIDLLVIPCEHPSHDAPQEAEEAEEESRSAGREGSDSEGIRSSRALWFRPVGFLSGRE